MSRQGQAPEGGTSFKHPNPNYPQEGITLPSPEENPEEPTLYERLRLAGIRQREAGVPPNWPPRDFSQRQGLVE